MPSCLRRETPSALIRPVRGRLTAALCQPSIPLSRAGSLDPRGNRSCALWHRLLGRPVSESGRLCHGDGPDGQGDRRRRSFVLPILILYPPNWVIVSSIARPARTTGLQDR